MTALQRALSKACEKCFSQPVQLSSAGARGNRNRDRQESARPAGIIIIF